MARLPIPGSDSDTWGDILNDFLRVEHNNDGTLKSTGSLASAQPLDSDLTDISSLSPSNNDLLQRKAGVWANRTPAQVKTDLALTKGDVGLSNVDNTSDASKPISTATQAAVDAVLARINSTENFSSPLTSGETNMFRMFMRQGTSASLSGHLNLSYFTATRTETITKLTFSTAATAAGATPTLCRYCVYSVAANGDLTLVASTANDTTLFATTHTQYQRTLTAAWSKVAGQRYAAGYLIVSAAAIPTFYGIGDSVSTPPNFNWAMAPRITGVVTGQTDLPSSVTAASVLTTRVIPMIEMLP